MNSLDSYQDDSSPYFPKGDSNFAVQEPDTFPLEGNMSHYGPSYRAGDAAPEYAPSSLPGHHTGSGLEYSQFHPSIPDVQPELPSQSSSLQSYQQSAQYLHQEISQAPVPRYNTATAYAPIHAQAHATAPVYQELHSAPYSHTYQSMAHRSANLDYSKISLKLKMRQHPAEGVVVVKKKEKSRKPIDPPPIVQIYLDNPDDDPASNFLQNPYFFMVCTMVDADEKSPSESSAKPVKGSSQSQSPNLLMGTTSSSLHRLKDQDNKDAGFFIFGDLSPKDCTDVGFKRLHFSLYELQGMGDPSVKTGAVYIAEILSKPFKVVANKDWKGLQESTYLSRAFSDQGVRLRLRKEPRTTKHTKRSRDDFEEDEFSHGGPSASAHVKHEYDNGGHHVEAHRDLKRHKGAYGGHAIGDGKSDREEHHDYRSNAATSLLAGDMISSLPKAHDLHVNAQDFGHRNTMMGVHSMSHSHDLGNEHVHSQGSVHLNEQNDGFYGMLPSVMGHAMPSTYLTTNQNLL